jgi:hypothetical protein
MGERGQAEKKTFVCLRPAPQHAGQVRILCGHARTGVVMGRRACILLARKFDPVTIKTVMVPEKMGVPPLFLLVPPATRIITEDVLYRDDCFRVLGCSSASLTVHDTFCVNVDAGSLASGARRAYGVFALVHFVTTGDLGIGGEVVDFERGQ